MQFPLMSIHHVLFSAMGGHATPIAMDLWATVVGFSEGSSCAKDEAVLEAIDPSGACHLKREHQVWPPVPVPCQCGSQVQVVWADR